MAKRRRIGEFPQNVVSDQGLPSRIVVDERLDVLLQQVGSDSHLIILVAGRVAVHDTSWPSRWSKGGDNDGRWRIWLRHSARCNADHTSSNTSTTGPIG